MVRLVTKLAKVETGMYLTGIGGGSFILIRDANGAYEFIDAREAAPAVSNETMYDDDEEKSIVGGLAK